MGQIQNAISGAVGSVAVGAIAEQKTKGMKKELADLNEYMALNHELIEDQQREISKLEQRHSELKAKTAETSKKANLKAMDANKNNHHNWIRLVKVKSRGEE